MMSRATNPAIRSTTARRRRTTWVALGLLTIGLTPIVFLLAALATPGIEQTGSAPTGPLDFFLIVGTMAGWSALVLSGSTLAILRPRSPIGWLLLVGGIFVILTSFTPLYVELVLEAGWSLPGYRLLDWLHPVFESLGSLLVIVWVPLLFPNGHLPGPRWRPMAWAILIATPVALGLTFLADNDEEYGRTLPNPTALGGVAEELAEAASVLVNAGFIAAIVLAFASIILRFRRSRGSERQQLKWFLAAIGLLVVALMASTVGFVTGIEIVANTFYFAGEIARGFLPIAIGIAVLRYRLYEIDRLISRTIGWALVTALLVGTFAVLVLGSSAVLEPLTGGNTLAVAGATLVVVALFAPLRSRVQRAVDRRFDRARYDGERLVGAFGERLRDEVDLETIRTDVLGTVDAAVRPASMGLWLRERPRAGR